MYPVHKYMRLAGWERPREHPPLEALLYLQGKHPATISILHRYGPDGLEFNGFRTTDWARVTTRSEVSKLLGRLFPGERLQVDCRDLRFRIPSVGLAAVEFFCFLPAMDIRLRYAVNGPFLKQDLAPALRDLSSLSDHSTGYVIPVGYLSAPGAAPRLGPALEIRRAQ